MPIQPWAPQDFESFSSEIQNTLRAKLGLAGEEGVYSIHFAPNRARGMVRLEIMRRGEREPLIMDVAPGPRLPGGDPKNPIHSLLLPSMHGGSEYSRVIGREIYVPQTDPGTSQSVQASNPFDALVNYIRTAFDVPAFKGMGIQGKFNFATSVGFGSAVGSLMTVGPFDTQASIAEKASRVSVGFGSQVRNQDPFWKEWLPNWVGTGGGPLGTGGFYSALRGAVPLKGDDDVVRMRYTNATDPRQLVGDVYGFKTFEEPSKVPKRLNIDYSLRETSPLFYQLNQRKTGLVPFTAPRITGMGDEGIRTLNIDMGNGPEVAYVQRNAAATAGMPLPGEMLRFNDPLAKQGLVGPFAQTSARETIHIPRVQDLANAQFEWGIMQKGVNRAGENVWTKIADLQGYAVGPNQSVTYGTYRLRQASGELGPQIPLTYRTDTRQAVLTGDVSLNLPPAYSTETGYPEPIAYAGRRHTAEVGGDLLRQITAAAGGAAVQLGELNEFTTSVGVAYETGLAGKGHGAKYSIGDATQIIGAPINRNVTVAGQGVSVSAVTSSVKTQDPQWMYKFGALPRQQQTQLVNELYPDVPGIREYMTGLGSKVPNFMEMAGAAGYTVGDRWEFANNFRNRFMGLMAKDPVRVWKQYHEAVSTEGQWLPIGATTPEEAEQYNRRLAESIKEAGAKGLITAEQAQSLKPSDFYKFEKAKGTNLLNWSFKAPFTLGSTVSPVVNEQLWKGVTYGYEELAAINETAPELAQALGLGLNQPQGSTGVIPPHVAAWRTLNMWNAYQFPDKGGKAIVPTMEGLATTLTKKQTNQILSKLSNIKDDSLMAQQEAIESVVPGAKGLLVRPGGDMIPTPSVIEQISAVEYGPEGQEIDISSMAKKFGNTLFKFLGGASYEGELLGFKSDVADILSSKNLTKLLVGRNIPGGLGGRFKSMTGLGLNAGLISKEQMMSMISGNIKAQGLNPRAHVGGRRSAPTLMNQAYNDIVSAGGMPSGFLTAPMYSRDILPLMLMTPEMARGKGLDVPDPSNVSGQIRLGSTNLWGIAGKFGLGVERLYRDFDLDPNSLVPLWSASKSGTNVKESVSALKEQLSLTGADWEAAENAVLGVIGGKPMAGSGSVSEMIDVVAENTNPELFKERIGRGLVATSQSEMIEYGLQQIALKQGMGTNYNARRLREAAMSSLGEFSVKDINAMHRTAGRPYSLTLEQKLPYESRALDKMINTFTPRIEGDLVGGRTLGFHGIFGSRKFKDQIPFSLDSKLMAMTASRVFASDVEKGFMNPEDAFNLFAENPEELSSMVSEYAGGKGTNSPLDIMSKVIDKSGFSLSKTPIGLMLATELTMKIHGLGGRNKYRFPTNKKNPSPWAGQYALDVLGDEEIAFGGQQIKVRDLMKNQQIRGAVRRYSMMTGKDASMNVTDLVDIESEILGREATGRPVDPMYQFLREAFDTRGARIATLRAGVMENPVEPAPIPAAAPAGGETVETMPWTGSDGLPAVRRRRAPRSGGSTPGGVPPIDNNGQPPVAAAPQEPSGGSGQPVPFFDLMKRASATEVSQFISESIRQGMFGGSGGRRGANGAMTSREAVTAAYQEGVFYAQRIQPRPGEFSELGLRLQNLSTEATSFAMEKLGATDAGFMGYRRTESGGWQNAAGESINEVELLKRGISRFGSNWAALENAFPDEAAHWRRSNRNTYRYGAQAMPKIAAGLKAEATGLIEEDALSASGSIGMQQLSHGGWEHTMSVSKVLTGTESKDIALKAAKGEMTDEQLVRFNKAVETATSALKDFDKYIQEGGKSAKTAFEFKRKAGIKAAEAEVIQTESEIASYEDTLSRIQAGIVPKGEYQPTKAALLKATERKTGLLAKIAGLEESEPPGLGQDLRKVFGGFGLFYMGTLAKMGMGAWSEGLQATEQYNQAISSQAQQLYGVGAVTPFASVANYQQQAQLRSGGGMAGSIQKLGSYMSGLSDITGSVAQGIGATLMASFSASAFESAAPAIYKFLNTKAGGIGLAVGAGSFIATQVSNAINYQDTMVQVAAQMNSGLIGQIGAGFKSIGPVAKDIQEGTQWGTGFLARAQQYTDLTRQLEQKGLGTQDLNNLTPTERTILSKVVGMTPVKGLENLSAETKSSIMMALGTLPSSWTQESVDKLGPQYMGKGVDIYSILQSVGTAVEAGSPILDITRAAYNLSSGAPEEAGWNYLRAYSQVSMTNLAQQKASAGLDLMSRMSTGKERFAGESVTSNIQAAIDTYSNISNQRWESKFLARDELRSQRNMFGLETAINPEDFYGSRAWTKADYTGFTDIQMLQTRGNSLAQSLVGMGVGAGNAGAFVSGLEQQGAAGMRFGERLQAFSPTAIGQLALGIQAAGGDAAAISQYAITDFGLNGQMTGLGLWQTGLGRPGISAVQQANNIWGAGRWQGTAGGNAATFGINQRTGQVYTSQQEAQAAASGGANVVGGAEAFKYLQYYQGLEAQTAQIGIQGAQIALQEKYQPLFWAMEDKQRALSWRQQEWGFGQQAASIAMSSRHAQEQWGLQSTQMFMQRSWAQEDWGYQDLTRNLQWGWKQEDFQEQSRFMTGRQRRLAERGMERETIMHGLETNQIEKSRDRQKQLWALEDERFALQKQQFNEQKEFQTEALEKQREFFEEGKALTLESVALNRQYQREQLELQKQSLGVQTQAIEKQKELSLQMLEFSTAQDLVVGNYKLASEEQTKLINQLITGYKFASDEMINIINHAVFGEEYSPRTFGGGSSAGGGGSGAGVNQPETRAIGGDMFPGRSYLVGDRGMERVRSGTIGSVVNQYDLISSFNQTDKWASRSVFSPSGSRGSSSGQVVNIYLGNEKLGSYVLDTVKKDIEVL